MSTSLVWKPVSRDYTYLSIDLKFAMQKKYGSFIDTVLDASDITYLTGLRDAGIDDARVLIDAIEQRSEIKLEEIA